MNNELLKIKSPFRTFGYELKELGVSYPHNKEDFNLCNMIPKVVYNKEEEIPYGVY